MIKFKKEQTDKFFRSSNKTVTTGLTISKIIAKYFVRSSTK